MLNFDSLIVKKDDTPNEDGQEPKVENQEEAVDVELLEMELDELIEELDSADEEASLEEYKESVKEQLVTISETLKETEETDTSLLKHLTPHLAKCGIEVESNTEAVEAIDEFVTHYEEINKPADIDPEKNEVGTEALISTILITGAIVAALAAAGTMIVVHGLIFIIGIKTIKALFKLGGWLLGFTKDNDELMSTKKFSENSDKYKLVDAKDCIGLASTYDDIANGIMKNPDKFDVKIIEGWASKLKPYGYVFDGNSFKPKTVLIPQEQTLATAGWSEGNIRECNSKLKDLGKTLVKFEQVMKAAEAAADKAKKQIAEKKEEGEEPSPKEKEAAKEAVKLIKTLPKLMMKDAKRIAKANRYTIKVSMK